MICSICPHRCKVKREKGNLGFCKATNNVKVALFSVHRYEEPCISGKNGSGTIFFSHCNMRCMFCQNYEISQQGKGQEYTVQELANIFLLQQQRGVHNINLVSPTVYIPSIIQALKIAKEEGLTIPVIYNSNGYESVNTLKLLDGFIDIYLPDFKYYFNSLAEQYSGVKDYFDIVTKALEEMKRQVGDAVFDKQGMLQKGLLIRHLILPNHIENTKEVLKWIKENLGQNSYISVMAQYFPTYLAKQQTDLNRKITKREYTRVEEYLYHLELKNGYLQELGKHEEEYVPKW